jgi:hypothetical protein
MGGFNSYAGIALSLPTCVQRQTQMTQTTQTTENGKNAAA